MIGGFEIVDLAGHGGSSLVWRARHVSGTPAALKVLKGSVLHRPALREALELEVQRLASLDHAGIVQVYDAGVVTAEQAAASGGDLPLGSPWFALEWVGGGTLDQRLPMGWAELRPVLQQLLDALGASHGRGLLHLDLKPHNVLVRDLSVGWVPVITDFGIAARMGTAGTEGTEGFAPPEQLEGGERGPWTDLYALGRTIGSILAGRGVQPATVHPALPAWLGALTADDPGERPASAWEALERLPGTGPPVRTLRDEPTLEASLPLFAWKQAPLVGLEQARERVATAIRLTIVGPAGSGKSRLLAFERERVARSGGVVVELNHGARAALETLLTPPLRTRLRGLLDALERDLRRDQVGVAWLVRVLDTLAATTPVTVFIDDAPRVPDALAVARRLPGHVRLIAVDATPARGSPALDTVELPTPSRDALTRILEAHLPLRRSDCLRIATAANGNAGVALASLRALVEAGAIQTHSRPWTFEGPVPAQPGSPLHTLDLEAVARFNHADQHALVLEHLPALLARTEPNTETWVRLHYLRLLALGFIGSLGEALDACDALIAWAAGRTDPTARWAEAIGRAERVRWLPRAGRAAEARAESLRAVEIAAGTKMEGAAWLYRLMVLPSADTAAVDQAIQQARRAWAQRPTKLLDVENAAALRLLHRGELDLAQATVDRVLSSPHALRDHRLRAQSLASELQKTRGDEAGALVTLTRLCDELGREDDPALYAVTHLNVADLHLRSGEVEPAKRAIAPLVEWLDPAARVVGPLVHLTLASIAAQEGDHRAALIELERVHRARDERVLQQPDVLVALERIRAHLPSGAARASAIALAAHLDGLGRRRGDLDMDPTRDAIITALSSIQGASKPLTAAALAERLQEPIPLEDAVAAGWIEQVGEFVQLTPAALGDATGAWTRSMQAGFGKTLVRAMNSPAYQAFNVRVYGTERFQFNMIDPEQAERIANFGNLGPGKRFVDLGCATGTMTAWIADHTGAAGVGLDFAPAAIAHARGLFADRTDLRFDEGDLNALRPPDEPFDVAFALDSLYFATDLAQTLAGIALLVKPGGRLVAPYTQTVTEGRAPTEPDACTLGIALEQAGWDWVAVEASDEALWDREVTALAELQAQFEQEGSGDLWARREREASRMQACWREGRAIRWIFVAQRP